MAKRVKSNIYPCKGGITASSGFSAGGPGAGIKSENRPDPGIIYSDIPCKAAGTFTDLRYFVSVGDNLPVD